MFLNQTFLRLRIKEMAGILRKEMRRPIWLGYWVSFDVTWGRFLVVMVLM